MDYFDKYKKILSSQGSNLGEFVINNSKSSAHQSFINSPTVKDVIVDEVPDRAIVSISSKDFFDRQFLFPPDYDKAKLGSYIKFKDYTYLIMRTNDDDVYPNFHGKFCNEDFLIAMKTERVKVSTGNGYTYKNVTETESVPIVVDSKGYSIADNAVLPLPEGRVAMYMQYKPIYLEKIKINYEFELFKTKYKISDIQLDNVYKDSGYLTLSAQRVVGTDEA